MLINTPCRLASEYESLDEQGLGFDHIRDANGQKILNLYSLEEGLPEEVVKRINVYEKLISFLCVMEKPTPFELTYVSQKATELLKELGEHE